MEPGNKPDQLKLRNEGVFDRSAFRQEMKRRITNAIAKPANALLLEMDHMAGRHELY